MLCYRLLIEEFSDSNTSTNLLNVSMLLAVLVLLNLHRVFSLNYSPICYTVILSDFPIEPIVYCTC